MRTNKNQLQITAAQPVSFFKRTIRTGLFLSILAVLIVGFAVFKSAPSASAASCQPTGTTYGTDTMTVAAPGTSANIWVRMQIPSATDNSIMLQLDSSTCYNVGGSSSITPNTWVWVNYQNGQTGCLTASPTDCMQATNLAAGNHTLELIGTEPGVEVDTILLLTNGCVPVSTGSNCTSAQPSPSTPTLSGKAASPTTVALNWTQSTDSDGLSVAGYYVFRNGTKVATISNASTLTYTDTVSSGSNNTYTVQAYDNSSPAVTSGVSNAITVTPGLTPPTNVSAKGTSPTQITLGWSLSTDAGGSGLAGYQITRTGGSNGTVTDTVGSTLNSYVDNTVSPNIAYTYTVASIDSNNPPDKASAAAVQVTTPSLPTPPAPPTNFKASAASSSSVSLTWTGSPNTGGYYLIRNGKTLTQLPASAVSYTDSSVQPSTAYTYTLEAYNSTYTTDVSSPAASTPPTVTTPAVQSTPPTQPQGLSATPTSSSQINLSWTASTDTIGSVKDYAIYRSTTSGGTFTSVGTSTSTTYGDTGLSPKTTYYYYVIAYNTAGNQSQPSSPAVSAKTNAQSGGNGEIVTVEGTVRSANGAPLDNVYVHTGIHGTIQGAATSHTNSSGQYALDNITANHQHDYSFSLQGYSTIHFAHSYPEGIQTVNESLTPSKK